MDNVPIILGQYKVGKTLGIGAFGKVKRNISNHFTKFLKCLIFNFVCLYI